MTIPRLASKIFLVQHTRHFPSRDRLSVLTAMILLAYALMRLLNLPVRVVGATFFGSALGFELSGTLLMLVLVAALISAGSDTLIRSHPAFTARTTLRYWILPGATALVLGATLNRTPNGPVWLLELGLSALALSVVFIAEYIVVDPNDPAQDAAALALTALAYALALILFVLLRSLGARAAISATIGGLVAAGLAWRLLTLGGVPAGRALVYGGLVGLICAESIWALNYWRLVASAAGLIVMVPFYVGVGLLQQHWAGTLTRRMWLEFAIVGGLGLLIALVYAALRGL